MILNGESLGVKWSTVSAGNVKKHAVILSSKVHVHVIRREGQARRFGRPTKSPCLDDRQVVTITIASMNAGWLPPLMSTYHEENNNSGQNATTKNRRQIINGAN